MHCIHKKTERILLCLVFRPSFRSVTPRSNLFFENRTGMHIGHSYTNEHEDLWTEILHNCCCIKVVALAIFLKRVCPQYSCFKTQTHSQPHTQSQGLLYEIKSIEETKLSKSILSETGHYDL